MIKGGSVEIGWAPEETQREIPTNEYKIRPSVSYHCARIIYIMLKLKEVFLPQYKSFILSWLKEHL